MGSANLEVLFILPPFKLNYLCSVFRNLIEIFNCGSKLAPKYLLLWWDCMESMWTICHFYRSKGRYKPHTTCMLIALNLHSFIMLIFNIIIRFYSINPQKCSKSSILSFHLFEFQESSNHKIFGTMSGQYIRHLSMLKTL